MTFRAVGVVMVSILSWPLSPALPAQSAGVAAPRAEFEVASVKRHTSDDQRTMMVAQAGGRFVAINVGLRMIIRTAFQLQDDQIVGGPDWLDTDRFDIEARAASMPGAPTAALLEMLQSLLADRFNLTTHREQREVPVYALERVRRDSELGAGLRATACPDPAVDLSRPQPCTNISNGASFLSMRGMPLYMFAQYLAPVVNRVVTDRTGLDARFDIELKWSPEQQAPSAAAAPPPPPGNQDRPALFTAIQEQLGLRLVPDRAMVDVLVIDTLTQPTPN